MEYRIPVDRIQHCKEHLAMLDLLQEGDFAQASRLMHQHIECARLQKSPVVRQTSTPFRVS
jgi:DNA-binding GntR family transcriptional regulator